ncbi:MAG: hypothetical protein H7210_01470 [Pyrinomonadaceae bacterium]|nr:hypothetical protein [Phycisphaerales bacterium]
MTRTLFSRYLAVAAVAGLSTLALSVQQGCEDKAPPPSAGGGGTGSTTNNASALSATGSGSPIDRLAEEPKSLLGRSAKTAKNVGEQMENKQAEAAGLADEINGTGESLSVAGLRWVAPTRWEKKPPANDMRAAEFSIPGSDGDPAIVTFSNFGGAGQGGNVQSNVDRWKSQFRNPDSGGEPDFKQKKRKVAGVSVELIDIVGTYKDGMPGATEVKDRTGYAMRGAIIDGPKGLVFIKMWGPYETVLATRDEWFQLIDGMTLK